MTTTINPQYLVDEVHDRLHRDGIARSVEDIDRALQLAASLYSEREVGHWVEPEAIHRHAQLWWGFEGYLWEALSVEADEVRLWDLEAA